MVYVKLSILFNKKPPFFIGSQLRGALGYALKKIVCINPSFKCDSCFAKENCLYYSFYEDKQIYKKYRFDFELGKEYYDFSIYLFEETAKNLPYIISAFIKLLTEVGLGKDRVKIDKFDMFINDKKIDINNLQIPKDYIKTFYIDNFCPDVLIKFITPCRIKKDNRFIKIDELELDDILNSIYKRYIKLTNNEYKKVNFSGEIVKKDLKFLDLTRYSNRQKTKMKLGGIVGEIEVKNLDKFSYELLKLGEIIAVGKQTTFGLGKMEVECRKENRI